MTSESEVKSLLISTLNIIIIAQKTMLIAKLVPFTTITANLANFGWPAPSSFPTLTLHTKIHKFINLTSKNPLHALLFTLFLLFTPPPNQLYITGPLYRVKRDCFIWSSLKLNMQLYPYFSYVNFVRVSDLVVNIK